MLGCGALVYTLRHCSPQSVVPLPLEGKQPPPDSWLWPQAVNVI